MLATQDRREATAIEVLDRGVPTDERSDALFSSLQRDEFFSPSRRKPVLAMAAGLLLTALAVLSVVGRSWLPSGSPARATTAIGGPGDVQAQMATYAPGQSSGWHTHTGLHAVVVVTGILTIVDGGCQYRTFGPGESYVGGQEVHLALNQTASPLEIAVTYMFPSGQSHNDFHRPVPSPAGCHAE